MKCELSVFQENSEMVSTPKGKNTFRQSEPQNNKKKQGLLASRVRGVKTRTLIRAFQCHQPITEVDLHLDHVLEHIFFSRLRTAKTPS